jgi:hypothetical protein
VEPEILRRGKEFHRRVQAEWAGEIEGAPVHSEHGIIFGSLSKTVKHQRRGRLDIFISQFEDFVCVIEIKSTNWDRIQISNRQRLLAAHCRQVLRYVDKYLDHDHVNVCAGIIYPQAPRASEVKFHVEQYLNNQGLQVAWFDDA